MDKNKKIIAIAIVGAVVLSGVSFYAGTKFGGRGNFGMTGGRNFSGFDGQNFSGGSRMIGQQGVGGFSGGMASGEIISKDSDGITIKTPNGGSKIIFVSDSTEVLKSASGSVADLSVGTNVTVSGTSNKDGSITGKSIQIRPALPVGNQ